MKTTFFSFLVVSCLLFACSSSEEDTTKKADTKITYVDDDEKDVYVATIEAEKEDYTLVKSLMYLREDGSTASTYAYLDKEDQIKKIEEVHFDEKTNSFIYQDFYLKDGVLFVSKHRAQRSFGDQNVFGEQVSYYKADGAVLNSKDRVAQFEEYLGEQSFRKIDPVSHSMDVAYRMLRQEAEFQTTFQGFVNAGAYDFLIVGGANATDYTSSLALQEDNATLRYLRKEGKKALGQLLRVNFERFTDVQGYEMQILTDLALIKEQ